METKRSGSKKHSKKEPVAADSNDVKNRAQVKTDGVVNVSKDSSERRPPPLSTLRVTPANPAIWTSSR